MDNYTKKLLIRMLLLLFIIFFSYDLIYPIIEFITVRISYLLSLPLKPILTSSTTFAIGEKTIEIIPACVAFSAYILLASLILLTKDIKRDTIIKMFLIGSGIIFVVNILRIELLIYIWEFLGPELFEYTHLFFWKIVSIVIVLLTWIYLIRKYDIKEIPAYSDLKYLIKRIR